MSSLKSIDRVIEGLYCQCHDGNADFTKLRNNITLNNFANAVGGTFHMPKHDSLLLAKLHENHADYLPGGKYQLGYSHLAKDHIESLLDVRLNPVSVSQYSNCHNFSTTREDSTGMRRDTYFICKSCCPVCRSATRGCPLHCCKLCWMHLHKLDAISKDMALVQRPKKLKKGEIDSFIAMVTNDPTIPNGKHLHLNKGYFHNDMDIAFFLYINYELDATYCKNLIHQLSC